MQSRLLSKAVADEVIGALSSRYTLELCGGAVRLVTEPLPGAAVCVIVRTPDRVLLVVDLEKPLAHRHARQMIREAVAACGGESVPPSLVSDLLASQSLPVSLAG